MSTIADVISVLEQIAPPSLAADWDNSGLLIGDPAGSVRRIMTCLTVTPETAQEAVSNRTDLVVSHHPVMFRAIQRLTASKPEGRILLSLIRAGVAVYSPHTSFDNAPEGINDSLGSALGLVDVKVLRRSAGNPQCKVVVFVPEDDLQRVSTALFQAGAGNIGCYSECSFRASGMGTFKGSITSHPTVGQAGRREEVKEWRLEAVAPVARIEAVTEAIRASHSYEEPAFDFYHLVAVSRGVGEGRIGRLPEITTLGTLARQMKSVLRLDWLQMVGGADDRVERIAIVCGAGGSLLGDAIRFRADLFVTGELRFHDCLAAKANNVGALLLGHYASERLGVESLARRLEASFPAVEVWPSKAEADPIAMT
jgi:dinuclear metal center YbgI/SA1388 family protein